MDNKKTILALYLVAAILSWFLLRSGIEYMRLISYQVRRVPGILVLKELVPVMAGAVVFGVLYANARVNQVMVEVISELKKVTWPNRDDVVKSTTVVIICILIASLILAGFDVLWGKLISIMLHS